jgi:hypothetical protein
VKVNPDRYRETGEASVTFGEVLAELLRPPYVWWLLIAMVLQAYTPLYIAPVAAAIFAATVGFARQAVQSRRAVAAVRDPVR